MLRNAFSDSAQQRSQRGSIANHLENIALAQTKRHSLASLPCGAPAEDGNEFDAPLPLFTMKFTQSALRRMMEHLLSREPESAGILLGPSDDDLLITHFVADVSGRSAPASFSLDHFALNKVLKRVKPAGINCKGIGHSHPNGAPCPSSGDLHYLRRLFALPANAAAAQFYMPIVCGGRLYPYIYAQGRVWPADLILV